MKMFSYFGKADLKQLCTSCLSLFTWLYLHANKFTLELFYFLFVSSLGFCILGSLNVRTTTFTPRKLDLFFTSVSAATVSSMSTVEMEVFTNNQLVILTVLMFIGGEVFTSMVGHYIGTFFVNIFPKDGDKSYHNTQCCVLDQIELKNIDIVAFKESKDEDFGLRTFSSTEINKIYMEDLKYKSFKSLGVVVLFYLLLVQFLGVISVLIYLNFISSANDILKHKGIEPLTFSIFTIVSTFTNCGFVPTNENMLIFKKNSGLLLILIPQALLGNTLYPPVLRFSIWAVGKFTMKSETKYLLNNSKDIGYPHLLSYLQSSLLFVTVLAFIAVQFVLFSWMEWNSGSLRGLNVYQKLVGVFSQTVNTRFTGESIVDLSTMNAAVLVLFIVMMYLPPYTSFFPMVEECRDKRSKRGKTIMDNLIFSHQIYLVIFILLVCVFERKQMINDPLNFNVLNIAVEVISAYGNVGFSTGYNCDLRLKQEGDCQNKWYGFSGKWSDEGKLVLITVMIFGRLKKFNMKGGKAWKVF
ncbi:hypothetical protein R6Q57_030109 [Mikania cordata]